MRKFIATVVAVVAVFCFFGIARAADSWTEGPTDPSGASRFLHTTSGTPCSVYLWTEKDMFNITRGDSAQVVTSDGANIIGLSMEHDMPTYYYRFGNAEAKTVTDPQLIRKAEVVIHRNCTQKFYRLPVDVQGLLGRDYHLKLQ